MFDPNLSQKKIYTPLIGSFFLNIILLCLWFLPHSFRPFPKTVVLCTKTAPCPEAAAQATAANQEAYQEADHEADQAAEHWKAFEKRVSRLGFDWLQY
jgi:hypothetical protein